MDMGYTAGCLCSVPAGFSSGHKTISAESVRSLKAQPWSAKRHDCPGRWQPSIREDYTCSECPSASYPDMHPDWGGRKLPCPLVQPKSISQLISTHSAVPWRCIWNVTPDSVSEKQCYKLWGRFPGLSTKAYFTGNVVEIVYLPSCKVELIGFQEISLCSNEVDTRAWIEGRKKQ